MIKILFSIIIIIFCIFYFSNRDEWTMTKNKIIHFMKSIKYENSSSDIKYEIYNYIKLFKGFNNIRDVKYSWIRDDSTIDDILTRVTKILLDKYPSNFCFDYDEYNSNNNYVIYYVYDNYICYLPYEHKDYL